MSIFPTTYLTKIKSTVIILLVLIVGALIIRSCNRDVTPINNSKLEDVIKIKEDLLTKANLDLESYKDSIKFLRAQQVTSIDNFTNVTTKLKDKNSELRQTNLLLANQQSFITTIIKDTIRDNDTFYLASSFNYKDKWTTLKGKITEDSIKIDSLITYDYITINSGYRNISLFKREMYVEVLNKNPNTVLLSNQTIVLPKRRNYALITGILSGAIITYILTK